MIYDIRLLTASTYETSVPFARHVLRFTPRDRPGQRVLAHTLRIDPAPSDIREGHDFFGNETRWIAIETQHQKLVVHAEARVERLAPPLPDPLATPAWEDIRAAAAASHENGPEAPGHFLFASRLVKLAEEIGSYAAESFTPRRPVLAGAIALMTRLHDDFTYDSEATHVATTPAEAFALKRGVCQDFAHVMIAGLRAIGLPACYVSGLLRTLPPPGSPRLEGVDATHAWVSVWCGEEAGWISLDPTNSMPVGNDHIILGVGRDYADVAPMDGVIVTYGGQKLEVAVDVAPAPMEATQD